MNEVLTVNALSKTYGHLKALDRLSMRVPKGAVYGLVGKNGAGKTTLIRVICGTQEPASGGYTIFGISNSDKDIRKARRRMGAVIDAPSIYTHMTAEQNLREQCRILGMPSEDGITELLEMVGLEFSAKELVKRFSLGMRQRLGIALALAGNPDLLVLDEPFNGIDPQGIVELRALLLRLNREHQVTILISSHMLDELAKLASHYGFIERGQLIKEISAEELQDACRKCMRVTVSDTSILTRVLDNWQVEYEIISDTEADIFAELNVTTLVNALSGTGCELVSVTNYGESLESYYLSLVGGEHHV